MPQKKTFISEIEHLLPTTLDKKNRKKILDFEKKLKDFDKTISIDDHYLHINYIHHRNFSNCGKVEFIIVPLPPIKGEDQNGGVSEHPTVSTIGV